MEPGGAGEPGSRRDRLERFFLIGVLDLSQKTSCTTISFFCCHKPLQIGEPQQKGPYWCFKKIGGGGYTSHQFSTIVFQSPLQKKKCKSSPKDSTMTAKILGCSEGLLPTVFAMLLSSESTFLKQPNKGWEPHNELPNKGWEPYNELSILLKVRLRWTCNRLTEDRR